MSNKNPQHKWVFILIFLFLLFITIYMLKPYIAAIMVAALLAYFLYPLSEKLQKVCKHRIIVESILSVGTVLILLAVSAAMIVPLASQANTLYTEYDSYLTFDTKEVCSSNQESIHCQIATSIAEFIGDENFQEKTKNAAQKIASPLLAGVSSIFSLALTFIASVVVVIFAVFYFLEHGQNLNTKITNLLPLAKQHKKRIIQRLKDTIDAVVKGNVITAILQGILGAIIFALLGIPLSLFWGMLMIIFAFIPAIGPALIWVPAAILLLILGSPIKAIILTVYCLVILGYVDNVLKPKMIGNKIKLSSFAIFLGVLGGLQMFGILGLFLGPIIIALLVTCIDIYQEIKV